jgi:four helix bundle protein
LGAIKKFQDLHVWQEARKLCQMVDEYFLKNNSIRDYPLKDQLNRSSGSVMDNIAEGFGRGGSKEFRQFISISLGSLNESQSQIIRAHDRAYLGNKEYDELMNLSEKLVGMLINFSNYLSNTSQTGAKFKKN